MAAATFHPNFKASPYWWEAYQPMTGDLTDVPTRIDVAIIGAGYAGLSAAIELADLGLRSVVLEAGDPGQGASTRSGGAISGGVNVGKSVSGKSLDPNSDLSRAMLSDASDAFGLIDRLIEREKIDCFWQKKGRFVGAWTDKHFKAQAARVELLNSAAGSGCVMVPRERQREEIASDYYYGGMVVERAGKLHPALYYKGLLDAAHQRGVTICAQAPAGRIEREGATWRITTSRGVVVADSVMIATNGYTGDVTPRLKRRLVPIASHIIATEELDPSLAATLIPKGRSLSDTRRILCYYRMSPDGKRMIFGGRASFMPITPEVSAPILHGYMIDRFPQLKGVRVTHAWTGNVAFSLDAVPHMGVDEGMHYALACNGSGVAMMTYLGWATARKIAKVANASSAFDREEFPDHPLYNGNPWFLPIIGNWYGLRDRIDRLMAA